MSADVWFEPRVPDTETLPVVEPVEPVDLDEVKQRFQDCVEHGRPVVLPADLEYQHRAELDEIELPPSPLDAHLPPVWLLFSTLDWPAIGAWWLGVAQLALGVVLGYLGMMLLMVVLR